MVDFDLVLGEIKRTAYVGAGTFASASVGNFLEDFVPGGDVGVASAQMLAGAGGAYVARERLGGRRNTDGLDIDVGEAARHASYGVGGAGFAELADSITEDGTTNAEMVEVRTRSNAGSSSSSQTQSQTREDISLDV